MGYDDRKTTWFGTRERSMWIPTPMQGAEMSLNGWEAGGTLLNGGGYQFGSWDAHRTYSFEWGESSSYQAAQIMNSFASGTFGRSLIHFILPTMHDKNLLPPAWADPSITIGSEGGSLVPGVQPVAVPTSGGDQNLLPVSSAQYNLNGAPALGDLIGSTTRAEAYVPLGCYIPIPEGYTLLVGAIYDSTAPSLEQGGVTVSSVNGLSVSDTYIMEPLSPDSERLTNVRISGATGAVILAGGLSEPSGTLTLVAMTARLIKTSIVNSPQGYGELPYGDGPYGGGEPIELSRVQSGPWVGGMGNSGCRFVGKPTMRLNTGIDGGTAGYAVSLREVGAWTNR